MSPQAEALRVPPAFTLLPRQAHPLSTEEAMVLRDRDGRVLARIDTLRSDLLPS